MPHRYFSNKNNPKTILIFPNGAEEGYVAYEDFIFENFALTTPGWKLSHVLQDGYKELTEHEATQLVRHAVNKLVAPDHSWWLETESDFKWLCYLPDNEASMPRVSMYGAITSSLWCQKNFKSALTSFKQLTDQEAQQWIMDNKINTNDPNHPFNLKPKPKPQVLWKEEQGLQGMNPSLKDIKSKMTIVGTEAKKKYYGNLVIQKMESLAQNMQSIPKGIMDFYSDPQASPEQPLNTSEKQLTGEKLTTLLAWCKKHAGIAEVINSAIKAYEGPPTQAQTGHTWRNLSVFAMSAKQEDKNEFLKWYYWTEQEMQRFFALEVNANVAEQKEEEQTEEATSMEHFQVDQIVKLLSARTRNGFTIPLWLYGAPGAGKTTLGEQIAAKLQLRHSPLALGPTTTESKTVGYRNLINGEYVEGHCYKTFKEGGLCHLDEIDVADAGVLVSLNSILANTTYMFPNGELVHRHKDFTVLATANTIGTGAMHGFTRNRLDAATLDRFVKFKLHYDTRLERWLAGHADWVRYVVKCREFVEKHTKETVYITPRASMNGAALLRAGLARGLVADVCIFNAMNESMVANIKKEVGLFE